LLVSLFSLSAALYFLKMTSTELSLECQNSTGRKLKSLLLNYGRQNQRHLKRVKVVNPINGKWSISFDILVCRQSFLDNPNINPEEVAEKSSDDIKTIKVIQKKILLIVIVHTKFRST